MINFIINNLVVLLATVGIVSIVGLYLLCRTKPIHPMEADWESRPKPNYSNVPTSVGKSTMECCGDYFDPHAMSSYTKSKAISIN